MKKISEYLDIIAGRLQWLSETGAVSPRPLDYDNSVIYHARRTFGNAQWLDGLTDEQWQTIYADILPVLRRSAKQRGNNWDMVRQVFYAVSDVDLQKGDMVYIDNDGKLKSHPPQDAL